MTRFQCRLSESRRNAGGLQVATPPGALKGLLFPSAKNHEEIFSHMTGKSILIKMCNYWFNSVSKSQRNKIEAPDPDGGSNQL